jgi:YD repeat-containing protein
VAKGVFFIYSQGATRPVAYDDFGNRTYSYLDDGHTKFWHYNWDGENRLTKATMANVSQSHLPKNQSRRLG